MLVDMYVMCGKVKVVSQRGACESRPQFAK